MKTIARLFAILSAAASSLLYARIRAPINPLRGSLWILRLHTEAMTPFIALSGTVAAGLALLARSPMAMLTAMLGAVAAARDVRRVTAPHPALRGRLARRGNGLSRPSSRPGCYSTDGRGICPRHPSHGGSAMRPSAPFPAPTVACSVTCGNRPVACPIWTGCCVFARQCLVPVGQGFLHASVL
jgi:hypothetical protein